jgi:hypothetical protein
MFGEKENRLFITIINTGLFSADFVSEINVFDITEFL